jgi:hypothetical protein
MIVLLSLSLLHSAEGEAGCQRAGGTPPETAIRHIFLHFGRELPRVRVNANVRRVAFMNARRSFDQKLLYVGIALSLLMGALPPVSQAGKVEFFANMYCDEGYGGQFSGCVKLNRTGRFTAKLTGLPFSKAMSCSLECGLSGSSIDIPECGVTDENGNLNLDFRNLAEGFNGACVDLRVQVYDLDSVSCVQGFAAGNCQRSSRKNQNGTVFVKCKDVNCPNICTVHIIDKNTLQETDTGESEYTVPVGFVGTCPCQ